MKKIQKTDFNSDYTFGSSLFLTISLQRGPLKAKSRQSGQLDFSA